MAPLPSQDRSDITGLTLLHTVHDRLESCRRSDEELPLPLLGHPTRLKLKTPQAKPAG